ncbi:MAG: rod shape-determining protein MreD [Bacteroidota bacterium]
MNVLIKYLLMFVSLVLIQVLILNQIRLGGFVNPYIYILFVILLPLNAPRYVVMLLGFLIGLTIDMFMNSLGIHAAATVFIAYLRPLVVRSVSNHEEDRNEYPGLHQNKFKWFLSYATIMVVLHHLVLFYIEVFTLTDFFKTLYHVFLSSLFSVFIIVLSQFLIFRR